MKKKVLWAGRIVCACLFIHSVKVFVCTFAFPYYKAERPCISWREFRFNYELTIDSGSLSSHGWGMLWGENFFNWNVGFKYWYITLVLAVATIIMWYIPLKKFWEHAQERRSRAKT